MQQASGSVMTGIRTFSAQLPLTSLLWPCTALGLFVYFQGNTDVSYFWILFKTSTLVRPDLMRDRKRRSKTKNGVFRSGFFDQKEKTILS